MFITGESYAGIYVPYLSWQVHIWNQRAKIDSSLPVYPFKGFLVGNGVTDYNVDCDINLAETFYNFNVIS